MFQPILMTVIVAAIVLPMGNTIISIAVVLMMIYAMTAPVMTEKELMVICAMVNAVAISATSLSPIVHMFVLKMILNSPHKTQLANAYMTSIYLHFFGWSVVNVIIEAYHLIH